MLREELAGRGIGAAELAAEGDLGRLETVSGRIREQNPAGFRGGGKGAEVVGQMSAFVIGDNGDGGPRGGLGLKHGGEDERRAEE